MKRLRASAVVGVLLALVACRGEPDSGPQEVHWDRDTCEHCGMTLSDRRHAVQVRPRDRSPVLAFDDLGCAVVWIDEHAIEASSLAEIWIKDRRSGEWLDARSARYRREEITPMGWGFAADGEPDADSLDFEEVRRLILVSERDRHRKPPVRAGPAP